GDGVKSEGFVDTRLMRASLGTGLGVHPLPPILSSSTGNVNRFPAPPASGTRRAQRAPSGVASAAWHFHPMA
ncbi:hypothetical protein, partial [Brachybacterium alimentarium]|uniref:hypothetical protein n=1 Tax=Brachybacterium alimentarium TaxID=47845 RepID=UPI003FCF2325